MTDLVVDGGKITLDMVWDGDGNNQNAALTVFRHVDSASVVRGLVGPEPKTAWLIDYPLVYGFPAYGGGVSFPRPAAAGNPSDREPRLVPVSHREALRKLEQVRGLSLTPIPHVVFLNVQSAAGEDHYYTVLHNTAHSNMTSLFMESSNLTPGDDTLTVVKDFIGSYPNAYWQVAEADLPALVKQVSELTDEASYAALMTRYGVRRTSPQFWQHSDKVIAAQYRANPLENGLLDYNRLENR